MLDPNSYLIAVSVYVGAAVLAVLCLLWWLWKRIGPLWTLLIALSAAALLLTPAYPKPGVETMAPALIVAAFQVFTDGLESAMHALRPLAVILAAAWVLAILLRLLVFRGKPVDKVPAKPRRHG